MPGYDRTGPMGAGPMTGGARGFCNPAAAGYPLRFAGGGFRGGGLRRGFRGGYGPGRGYGRGFGWGGVYPAWGGSPGPAYGYPYSVDPKDEMEMLRSEAAAVKNDLDAINRRIEELEKKAASDA